MQGAPGPATNFFRRPNRGVMESSGDILTFRTRTVFRTLAGSSRGQRHLESADLRRRPDSFHHSGAAPCRHSSTWTRQKTERPGCEGACRRPVDLLSSDGELLRPVRRIRHLEQWLRRLTSSCSASRVGCRLTSRTTRSRGIRPVKQVRSVLGAHWVYSRSYAEYSAANTVFE